MVNIFTSLKRTFSDPYHFVSNCCINFSKKPAQEKLDTIVKVIATAFLIGLFGWAAISFFTGQLFFVTGLVGSFLYYNGGENSMKQNLQNVANQAAEAVKNAVKNNLS